MLTSSDVSGDEGGTRARIEDLTGTTNVNGRNLLVLGAGKAADLAHKLRSRRIASRVAALGGGE